MGTEKVAGGDDGDHVRARTLDHFSDDDDALLNPILMYCSI